MAVVQLRGALLFPKAEHRPFQHSSHAVPQRCRLAIVSQRRLSTQPARQKQCILRDGSTFLAPYRKSLQQVRESGSEEDDGMQDVEELALSLISTPCWLPIFEELTPSMRELKAVEQVLTAAGHCHSLNTIALAELLLLQGRFEEAELHLNKVIQDPMEEDNHYLVIAQLRLGMLLENLDRLDEAEVLLRQAAAVHEEAPKFLDLFLADHRRGGPSRRPSSLHELWLAAPLAFLRDLPDVWFGHLRLGLVYKSQGKERLANQNLFAAHTCHTTQALLGLHLERAGEVRDWWYKLIYLHGQPVTYPKPKPWTKEDDDLLLSRLAFEDPKSILNRRSRCKTPLWALP